MRYGALGDMVLITPLLRALAKRAGRPCYVLGRGHWCKDVFKELPFVKDVVTIVSRNAPYFINPDQWKLVKWLKPQTLSPIVIIETDVRSYRLLSRAGHFPTAYSCDLFIDINEHVTHHHARLGGFCDLNGHPIDSDYDFSPELRVSEDEITSVQDWLRLLRCDGHPIVLIQPGNRKTMSRFRQTKNLKQWPEDRWITVMKQILEIIRDARILIIGYRGEQRIAASLVRKARDPRILAVADQMNMRRLFALLKCAHSLISVDTGPAHAAAALQCPLVVLFGKTDPRVNRPLSKRSDVIVVTGPDNAIQHDGKIAWAQHHSMEEISADKVFDAWYGYIYSPILGDGQSVIRNLIL